MTNTDALTTPSFRLDGQVALVTGAGRGIGRAAALALAGAGADVVLLSRTTNDLLAVAREVEALGQCAHPVACDVTKGDQLPQTIAQLPQLDIVVNNAGINIPEPFVDVSEQHLDRLLALNVRAAFLCAQHAVRHMRERGRRGSVIHITSQMGHVGAANRTVYCMTKHAIEGLNKAMAVELAPHGIRVNAIAPTFIETDMTRPYFAKEEFRRDVLARLPIGRVGVLGDLMGAVVFLASPAAALITGTSLLVDGGWTAQ